MPATSDKIELRLRRTAAKKNQPNAKCLKITLFFNGFSTLILIPENKFQIPLLAINLYQKAGSIFAAHLQSLQATVAERQNILKHSRERQNPKIKQ